MRPKIRLSFLPVHITSAKVSIEQNEYDVTMIQFAGMAGGKAANVVMQYTPEEDAIAESVLLENELIVDIGDSDKPNAEAIKDLYVPRVNERPRHGAPETAESTPLGEDSIVFPNGPLKTLSEYVTFNRMLQAGDMVGALSKFGMDMATYGTVAAAWAQKMATDPALMRRYVRRLSA